MAGKWIYDMDAMARTAWRMLIPQPDRAIPLVDDRRNRSVEVVIRTDRGDSQARGVD